MFRTASVIFTLPAMCTVSPAGADTGLHWNLTCPVYRPPKKNDKSRQSDKQNAAQSAR